MKRIFIYILILVAIGLIIFNATKIDTSALMEGDSGIAVLMVGAGLCVIVLLAILLVSIKIQEKVK